MPTPPRPRIGLNLPLRLADDDPGAIAAWLGAVETAPVDALWTLDQLAGRVPTPEPVTLLGFAAARTTRVRLGIAVLVAPGRGPVAAAKQLASLGHLAGGRLVVGVGSGDRGLWPALRLGEWADRPGAVLDEFLTVVHRLWTEPGVTHDGPIWPCAGVTITPRPAAPPPLWVGGGSVPALRRALRLGSGWVAAGRQPTARFAELAARLPEVAAEEGRPLGSFSVAKRVYLLVEPDRARAHRTIDDWFTGFYGTPDRGREATVHGDVATCAAQLAELARLGVTDLILHPLDESPRHEAAVLGELLPALAASYGGH
ncbi:LLM class flavin-dependent oxidoreductase [Nonomuraea sp. MCN248]|uniref:LLM class flavin-dependent oxidoreductase n=1 Tax=Nonomuraea corallina TaxID=2989783 RepID=A0ABT4SLJ5_9ACTN|nr:LLM class flavin-dependent oxidoreductase [Nonomuraea corallina]MDA0637736.1 LLM class flavin-dependent oxidoreductase [Nonomuraea corallina]